MKKRMPKFPKIFLLAAAILLAVLLALGVNLVLNWPLWVGLFLVLLLAGTVGAGCFIRRFWLRRREKQFVQEVIEQDVSRMKGMADREPSDLKELQEQWKAGVDTLRGSHLKKHGNPLYILPWYLVIGESGAGKTTSLNSARLSSPFPEKSRSAGVSGTRNCVWWFLEQAVVIDTAGRYAVPVHEEIDQEEWRGFLRLLVKYRKREPLNGLIVMFAADRLFTADSETLTGDGRIMRRRIDELMRVLGVRFPVYLLVTKCDLIQGMKQFAGGLPEKSLDQPMGILNQDLSTDVEGFLESALATIVERLRNLRLQLLLAPQASGVDPGLLLFPEEFSHLKHGLGAFMYGTFSTNQYQETPMLRGLFFSSGQQDGSPYSHFCESLDIASWQESQGDANKGFFLHDFFAKILPKDRGMLAPTRRAIEWQHITGNLGLVSWMVLSIALCGLLSFSFVKNLSTIRQISHEFPRPPQLRGELLGDLITMDRYRQGIVTVEEQNRHWWIPRFGLTQSLKVEQGLKNRFCRQFHDGFLASFDMRMTERMVTFSPVAAGEAYGQYIVHLARRINLLKVRQGGQGYEALKGMPQPAYIPLLPTAGPEATSEVKKKFGPLYLSYLSWRDGSSDISRELRILQTSLKQLLALKGGDMRWLVDWVDRQGGTAPVTLAEFWGGSRSASDERKVSLAFTRKGKEEIESLCREIETALPDQRLAGAQRALFERWYRAASFASWEAFAVAFPTGSERLKGEQEWQQAAAKMSSDQGPYFAFLNRMALELGPQISVGNRPPWLQQLYQYQKVQAEGAVAEGRVASSAADGGKKLLVSLEKRIGKKVSAEDEAFHLAGSRAYRDYLGALTAIASATASRNQAYQAAAQVYGEDPAVGKSPFITAFTASRQLRSALAAGTVPSETFANLVNGPLDFLWSYVRKETAGYLQSQWEEHVLAGTLGMTGQQAAPILLGPDGLAWKFVKGSSAPFLTRTLRGYRAKEVLGGRVQFEGAFFAFLERGNQVQVAALTRQSNYNVGIKGLPTDANPDARLMPQATRLELQCGGSSQSLVNLNYPVDKTFNWSPDNCGDVQFQIEVGDLVLTRRYMGPQAFPEFLRDFASGQRIFSPKDFPGESSALGKLGIKYIKVNYQFIGSGQVIKQVSSVSCRVPRIIVRGWIP